VRWQFLTFGAGPKEFVNAAFRLGREAQHSGWFDGVTVETGTTLLRDHPSFWRTHSLFMTTQPRLFGYAIWKPYLLHHHLERLPSGWGLCYLDAGCVLNARSSAEPRLQDYRGFAQTHGMWATSLDQPRWGFPEFPEENWTKADLLAECDADDSVRSSPQYQSGMLMLLQADSTLSCLRKWRDLSVESDYHLISDAPSTQPNAAGFVEHRHDQSLFSIVAKVSGFRAMSDDTWFAPWWFKSGSDHPIWSAKWRSGRSMHPWSPRYVRRALLTIRDSHQSRQMSIEAPPLQGH
jgi:hypothetical protein